MGPSALAELIEHLEAILGRLPIAALLEIASKILGLPEKSTPAAIEEEIKKSPDHPHAYLWPDLGTAKGLRLEGDVDGSTAIARGTIIRRLSSLINEHVRDCGGEPPIEDDGENAADDPPTVEIPAPELPEPSV